MLEIGIIVLLATVLVTSVAIGAPLSMALLVGLAIFLIYGLLSGHKAHELLRMSVKGLGAARPILPLFLIIGMLTASWRAAGTIPAIACVSARALAPGTVVPLTFLLCSVMSVLMGSSFGAAATMGVICMGIGSATGASPALMGGAILSGCFFGDRCSPMSSTAVLVATLTNTSVFDNVRRMVRTGAVPFLACVALYTIHGAGTVGSADTPDFHVALSQVFDLSPIVLLPALVALALSAARVDVRRTMLASLACALAIAVGVQGLAIRELPALLVWGFHAQAGPAAELVNGGGIASMAEVALIVATVSVYSGLFEGTGLLDGAGEQVTLLARRTTPFVGVLVTSLVTSLVACDQILLVMVSGQLCGGTERDGSALALDLENSAILLPALFPWSTSCASILGLVGAPASSVLFACFAYLVPLWALAISLIKRGNPSFSGSVTARLLGLDERDDARLAA